MTGFRSLSDEQLAAKHDPTPWCHDDGEGRTLRYASITETPTINGSWHDPRVECIPSRDSTTYADYLRDFDPSPQEPWEGYSAPLDFDEWAESVGMPPVNPILVTFRHHYEHSDDWIENVETWITMTERTKGYFNPEWRDVEAREHARKVLTRLAVVFA